MSGRINYLQDSSNGKPKATFPGLLTGAVAFSLPLNEFMRLLSSVSLGGLVPAPPGREAELKEVAQASAASVKAVHRAGQTFLTWQEAEGVKEYRVFRSAEPIRDWARATLVGGVDDDSTLNFRVAASDFRDEEQRKGIKNPLRPKGPVKRDLGTDDQLPAVRQNPAYHFVIEPGPARFGRSRRDGVASGYRRHYHQTTSEPELTAPNT